MKKIKTHKGRVSQTPKQKIEKLGEYGIVSIEPGRITAGQIASVIMTLKRKLGGETTIIPRIKGHIAVSAKPLEVRMGKGKGAISERISRVRANTVIIEVRGGQRKKVEEGLRAAANKLPVRVKISSPQKIE